MYLLIHEFHQTSAHARLREVYFATSAITAYIEQTTKFLAAQLSSELK
jgi:hypothetical protein